MQWMYREGRNALTCIETCIDPCHPYHTCLMPSIARVCVVAVSELLRDVADMLL
jgi:hypothetical protein